VQVDPIKPMLKPPGTKRLKLKYDESPSNFAFKFNLRRYNQVTPRAMAKGRFVEIPALRGSGQGLTLLPYHSLLIPSSYAPIIHFSFPDHPCSLIS